MNGYDNRYQAVRNILELTYFASNVVIAVAVCWGLKQLRITRQIANTNARREAVRIAVDQCKHYADDTVPAFTRLGEEIQRLKLTLFPAKPAFTVQGNEIIYQNFDTERWDADYPKIAVVLVKYLNSIEFFAIPFAHGLADEDIGFDEAAMSFCQGVQATMPAFFNMRRLNAARYESAIRLYDLWTKRLTAKALAPAMKSLAELTKAIQQSKIKPVGEV